MLQKENFLNNLFKNLSPSTVKNENYIFQM